jgi:hypothetical protein
MRSALLTLVLLVAAGCGTVAHHVQRRSNDVHWPPVAESTRTQWYRGVEKSAPEPVTLSKDELETTLQHAAEDAGVVLVRTQYLPLLGGTAEIVVQPPAPVNFAEAGTGISTLLGPLGHDHRPYLVTVVDAQHEPLLMLGWTPHLEGSIGEGIAWQADDIHSGVIFGQPVTRSSNRLLLDDFEARLRDHDAGRVRP